MNKYKTTITTWNKVAKRYEEVFMEFELYNDTYDIYCNCISKKDPSILEVGCGPGNITKYLLQQRPDFKILATDVAPNMLEIAKQHLPEVTFRVLDTRHVLDITQVFDGIICGFCLPYLNQEDCIAFLKDCYTLLNSNGLLYFSVIEGDYSTSHYQSGSTGGKMFVHYYNEAFFKKHLTHFNFKDLQIIRKPYTTSQGERQVHLIIMARK